MTNMLMFPEHDSGNDDTPLPLLVAKKWGFPLAFHIVEGTYMYAIQDWLRGVFGEKDVRFIWANFQKQDHGTLFSKQRMDYKTSNGRTHQRDFVNDKGLYLITQYARTKTTRTVLKEIRDFLAASGAFVDEVRLDPKTVLTSGAITPDQALDAAIEMYRSQGKDDEWIQTRIQSKIKRDVFIRALGQAVVEILNRLHYAIATNDIYKGLWGRTAAILRGQLDVPKNGSLRDHQPTMALHFQGIAEAAAAHELGGKEDITWKEAREIVKAMADMVRPWVDQMSARLRIDIATGAPLIGRG